MDLFRGFRLVTGLLLGAVAAWLIAEGAMQIVGGGDLTAGALLGPVTRIAGGVAIIGIYYWALWSESRVHRVMENIFAIPELVKKLGFTLGLLAIYRIGFWIPLPGVDSEALSEMMSGEAGGVFGEALTYFGLFTGGSLQQSSLFGLGIMPYISAAIIFQLLGTVVPALHKLQKEGPSGYKKIQEYTRYATVVLCLVQATFLMQGLIARSIYPQYEGSTLVFMAGVIGLTTGTMFLMWLGEQIDEYGIGNGISLIIMAGIVSRMPGAIGELAGQASLNIASGEGKVGPLGIIFLVLAFVGVVAGAILITQGQRRIPIQQAKHTRGRRVYGGQRQYLPLRVNHGGVMPIIFASSLMIFPTVLFNWLGQNFPASDRWYSGIVSLLNRAFDYNTFTYSVVQIGLIFFFAFFWTTVQFRPKDMADQLRDYGSFIPGLRPGKRTAEYLERVMERITYVGAAFLAVIAVLPQVIAGALNVPPNIAAFLGGTGLLITVSVTLDLVQRIEANLVMRNYGGFLGGSSRIKGAHG
jgi:preprotein translocase subunit SecY